MIASEFPFHGVGVVGIGGEDGAAIVAAAVDQVLQQAGDLGVLDAVVGALGPAARVMFTDDELVVVVRPLEPGRLVDVLLHHHQGAVAAAGGLAMATDVVAAKRVGGEADSGEKHADLRKGFHVWMGGFWRVCFKS